MKKLICVITLLSMFAIVNAGFSDDKPKDQNDQKAEEKFDKMMKSMDDDSSVDTLKGSDQKQTPKDDVMESPDSYDVGPMDENENPDVYPLEKGNISE